MAITTYTEARNNFKKYCDMTAHESILIKRKLHHDVVMMSLSMYDSILERLELENPRDKKIALESEIMERTQTLDEFFEIADHERR